MDAAEAFTLPQDLVFVDLETTGGNAAFHRITEVGIVRMTGDEVVEEWSSLVDPGCRIPSYIEAFTGITNAMVAGAPSFADIAGMVREKLGANREDTGQTAPLFVAHNARFDYAFLRTEFRRLDVHFSAKVLCTVKLSRRLFPEFPRHSLDAIMERHRLTCSARHRALGDARVLGDFWRTLCADVPRSSLTAAVQVVLGANRLPAYLPADLAEELPEGPGVYRFFGEDNVLLYIGKSHSLRTRVLGHFTAEHADAQEQKKARLVRRVDWVETAGDLGAQLTESAWIKEQKPLFNRRLKTTKDSFTLRAVPATHGVQLLAIGDLDAAGLADCFGVFQSAKDGRKALTDIARAHSLCLKVLGVEESNGSCFAYQVGRCKGACLGKEPVMLHAMRLQLALSSLKLKPWPFPGRIALQEGPAECHVLDPWSYLGTARSEEQLAELAGMPARPAFDADIYRILVRYLARHPRPKWHDLRRRVS
jgi:DNA polymerase-3 subunit epsilon